MIQFAKSETVRLSTSMGILTFLGKVKTAAECGVCCVPNRHYAAEIQGVIS